MAHIGSCHNHGIRQGNLAPVMVFHAQVVLVQDRVQVRLEAEPQDNTGKRTVEHTCKCHNHRSLLGNQELPRVLEPLDLKVVQAQGVVRSEAQPQDSTGKRSVERICKCHNHRSLLGSQALLKALQRQGVRVWQVVLVTKRRDRPCMYALARKCRCHSPRSFEDTRGHGKESKQCAAPLSRCSR